MFLGEKNRQALLNVCEEFAGSIGICTDPSRMWRKEFVQRLVTLAGDCTDWHYHAKTSGMTGEMETTLHCIGIQIPAVECLVMEYLVMMFYTSIIHIWWIAQDDIK